jgi:hypothetical protein
MKINKLTAVFGVFLMTFFVIESCQKSKNPFDDIDRPTDETEENQPFDTATITGLHRTIFKEKCAIPSCHGGTFEPDFRTPQSSWSTLVWAPVIKNTDDYRFQFRVVPKDEIGSWLIERCVTDDPILGRMPRYADPLTDREIFLMKKWIANGARDVNNQPAPPRPNLNLRCWDVGCWAGSDRQDLNRPEWSAPFSMPKNTTVALVPFLYDEDTPAVKFKNVKLLLSKDVNFASSINVPLTFNSQYETWNGTLNTGQFAVGDVVYMRIFGRDEDHNSDVQIPSASALIYLKKHLSFVIE